MKRGVVLAVAVGIATAIGVGSHGTSAQAPSADEADRKAIQDIGKIADTPKQLAALRAFIAGHPKSAMVPLAKRYVVEDLVELKAPAAEIVTATEDAAALASEGSRYRVYNMSAMALADRKELLDTAKVFATKAVAGVPPDDPSEKANVQDTLGWVELQRDEPALAVESLRAAAAVLADNQDVLNHLGAAYEKTGKLDLAEETYLKSASVFLGTNASGEERLRAIYAKQHGSLDGLDAKLAAAREASKRYVIFESRKWDKPAPAWELKDLAGKPVKLADFKGKLVVMDFWGSWCPPCRAELPKFQALADKYKQNDKVVFLGMNWEKPGEPAERLRLVSEFMAKNHYTFPVVIDHDKVAVESYAIEGFPTVYIIDPEGQIRYRNLGYEDGVEQVIEAQLESLMK